MGAIPRTGRETHEVERRRRGVRQTGAPRPSHGERLHPRCPRRQSRSEGENDVHDSWFDPPKARQAALDQIAAGADLIYAEREGAIAAAREKGMLAFGNLLDQHGESPDTVITGPVWSMTPVVDYLISLSAAGKVYAENLVDFSTLARGNAALAPWHGWDGRLPADVMQLMREKERALKAGSLVLNPSTERPTGD